jgi:pimeloyl-ACP methyl ester carboxylesterase
MNKRRTSNVEHRTSNVEVKTINSPSSLRRSTFDVRRSTFAFSLLCLLTTSCARLSPGQFGQANPPNICLIRGYLDWYSTGIDQLTADLKKDGYTAEAFREEQWSDLADDLAKHPQTPLVLIGFSYGADDCVLIARKLNDRHLPVDLLITLDPVTPADIPGNVKKCVNFYEPNGFWDIFPWLRGIPVNGGENINVRSRPDLVEPDTSHATIAGNEKIHRAIRDLIPHDSAACPQGRVAGTSIASPSQRRPLSTPLKN